MKNYYLIAITTIFITILLARFILPELKKKHIGQNIRQEGPKSHYAKAGTPTMGGIIFILAVLIMNIIGNKFSLDTRILILSTLAFSAVGFIDDFRKLIKKRSLGLTAKEKIILQVFISLVICLITYFTNKTRITELMLILPLEKTVHVGLWGLPIMMIILIGTVNAVNLTDGLDGLASSVSIPVFLTFAILSENMENKVFAVIFAASLVGFLFYNSNPASVFMGDTGSMAIGGAVAGLALNMGLSIFLLIIGGVYVMETLSVIIQVISYKTRNKKRVFLMTPIHHHFELKGYKETKIVTAFTNVSILLCLFALLLLK